MPILLIGDWPLIELWGSISQGAWLKVDQMKFDRVLAGLNALKEGIKFVLKKLDGPFGLVLIGNSFPFLMKSSDPIVNIDHKLIEIKLINLSLKFIF